MDTLMVDPNMSDEPRVVVLEPPKPPQPRAKQYFVKNEVKIGKTTYKTGTIALITEEDAQASVSTNDLIPLSIAISLGLYPPKKETLGKKLKDAVEDLVEGDQEKEPVTTEVTSTPKTGKKSFLDNKLREAIQKKKAEQAASSQEPAATPQVDASKLEAIKSGGKAK